MAAGFNSRRTVAKPTQSSEQANKIIQPVKYKDGDGSPLVTDDLFWAVLAMVPAE